MSNNGTSPIHEAYWNMAKDANDRLEQRRSYEWKMCFSIWTAYAILVVGFFSHERPLTENISVYVSITSMVFALLFSWFWLWKMQKTNVLDRQKVISWKKKYFEKVVNSENMDEDERVLLLPSIASTGVTKTWGPWWKRWLFCLSKNRLFKKQKEIFEEKGKIWGLDGNAPWEKIWTWAFWYKLVVTWVLAFSLLNATLYASTSVGKTSVSYVTCQCQPVAGE